MAIQVFDYRTDVRNVVVMPDIRSRFLRMEPGEVATRHSHDLGQEVFLVLEGQCEFEIEGERAILGPGQMCFAAVDQLHQVRTVGDQPMTMYLSVTPHIEPTHTLWNDTGEKEPPRYGGSTAPDRAVFPMPLVDPATRANQCADAAVALAHAARDLANSLDTAREALTTGAPVESVTAKATIDSLWPAVRATFLASTALGSAWNDLATIAFDE